jgi:hypothetical protein
LVQIEDSHKRFPKGTYHQACSTAWVVLAVLLGI